MTRTGTAAAAVAALLLALPLPAASAAPPPAERVERILQASGGLQRWEAVRTLAAEGRIAAKVRGEEGKVRRAFARPGRLRVTLEYPGGAEVRVLDGERGWRTGPDGALRPVDGFLLSSMALQAIRADLPWVLWERRGEVRAIAPIQSDGRELPGLELTLGPGMLLRVYTDPDRDLVLRSQAVLNAPPMRTHFETDYANFREVEGLVLPFREENYASGVWTGTTVLERVEVNPALPPSTFEPR